jgi:DNA-binding transcriptional LysR family regulator
MDLRQLRYFIATAENRSFRRAAEQLEMAQPPLSQSIKQLENDLGVQLFERSRKNVALTPSGEVFLVEARLVLEQLTHAVSVAQRVGKGDAGRLRVGLVTTATYGFLPALLRRFSKEHPGINLSLREATTLDVLRQLENHQIDVGFARPLPGVARNLVATPVLIDRFIAAVPERHRLGRQKSLRLDQLAGEPFVIFTSSASPTLHQQIMNICRATGFIPNVVQDARQVQSVLSFVAGGAGVALVPGSVRAVRIDGVVLMPVDDAREALALELLALHREGDSSPATAAFVQAAVSVGRDPTWL